MKKFLALLLTLVMALSLAACGGSDEESTGSPAEDPAANEESSGSAADVKIGLICVHDINSGYDAAHIEGLTAACEELGIDANSQVIFRYNIAEDENCYDAAVDLAEEGCNIIFSDSYGHQSYMLDAAEDYPTLPSSPAPATWPPPPVWTTTRTCSPIHMSPATSPAWWPA